MSLFSMLKRNSKLALRGSWGRAVFASAIVLGAVFALSMVQDVLIDLFVPQVSFDAGLALRFGFSEFFFEQFAATAPLEWAILALFAVLELLLVVPLTLGVTRWHFLLVREEEPGIAEMFHFFESPRRFGRAVWLHVNLLARCVGWAVLLLLLPGLILGASLGVIGLGEGAGRELGAVASMGVVLGLLVLALALFLYGALINRYLAAPYLVCESDEVTVRGAIKQSVRDTRGYRFSLLWYQLSFIGWGLLCVFVLPALYVIPYIKTAVAMYARYVIERGRFSPAGATREFRPEDGEEPLAAAVAAERGAAVQDSRPAQALPAEREWPGLDDGAVLTGDTRSAWAPQPGDTAPLFAGDWREFATGPVPVGEAAPAPLQRPAEQRGGDDAPAADGGSDGEPGRASLERSLQREEAPDFGPAPELGRAAGAGSIPDTGRAPVPEPEVAIDRTPDTGRAPEVGKTPDTGYTPDTGAAPEFLPAPRRPAGRALHVRDEDDDPAIWPEPDQPFRDRK